MAYTDYTAVKRYLNIDTVNDGDDTLLTTLIARAQAEIDRFCARTFEASTNTVRYFNALTEVDTRDYLTLYLQYDLCSINTITNGDNTTISSGYTTKPKNETPYYAIRLLPSSGLAWTYEDDPDDAIAISGKWAYSTTAPADIVQATIELTAWMYRRRDNFVDFERPQVSPDGTTFVPTAMPRSVCAVLEPYKKLMVNWERMRC